MSTTYCTLKTIRHYCVMHGSQSLQHSFSTTLTYSVGFLFWYPRSFYIRICFIYPAAEFEFIYIASIVVYWPTFSLMFLIHLSLYEGVYRTLKSVIGYLRNTSPPGYRPHSSTETNSIYYDVLKLEQKPVLAKRNLISTAKACFEELFQISDVNPFGYKPFRLRPSRRRCRRLMSGILFPGDIIITLN